MQHRHQVELWWMDSLKVFVTIVTLVPKINYKQLHVRTILMNQTCTLSYKRQVENEKVTLNKCILSATQTECKSNRDFSFLTAIATFCESFVLKVLCKQTKRACGQQFAKVLFTKCSTFNQFSNVFSCKRSNYSIGIVCMSVTMPSDHAHEPFELWILVRTLIWWPPICLVSLETVQSEKATLNKCILSSTQTERKSNRDFSFLTAVFTLKLETFANLPYCRIVLAFRYVCIEQTFVFAFLFGAYPVCVFVSFQRSIRGRGWETRN